MPDVLGNRRPYVLVELGNRADIAQQASSGGPSRIDNWIWQSYLNLGMSYPFDDAQLSITGQWQAGMDSIAYPVDARRIDAIQFYLLNGGIACRVSWKDISYLRRYPPGPGPLSMPVPSVGPPSVVADFGQQIFVRPLADSNIYNYVLDYWAKPTKLVGQSDLTADPPYTSLGSADIGGTQLLVPNDWLEVIDMGAMMRGHASLGEPEKAQALQQLLYGFTVPTTGKFVPGLIAQMWNRRQAQAPAMDYSIQPRQAKRRYTNS